MNTSTATKSANAEIDLEEEDEDTLKDKFLTFHIGKEDYGIAIRHVTEIIGIQKITTSEGAENYYKVRK